MHLLNRFGIPARPILVDTGFRRTVSNLLPTPNLFNHVVVEYELHGQTHWVDATLKHQGGNVLTTFVPEFGFGLPVDPACSELVECPRRPVPADIYDLKETILLDTTGEPSLLSVLLRAKGCYAESIRQELQEKSEDEFAKERLESCIHRFSSATRSGPLQHRDDRASNEFTIVEVFEINGFLLPHDDPDQCRFVFPGTPVTKALVMPEPGPRKAPFALPHPCNLHHTVEIQSPALKLVISPRSRVGTPHLQFARMQKSLSSYCSITSTLSTFSDHVLPEHLAQHRKAVEEIWKESGWEITVATGFARPRRRSDFGELPPLPQKPLPSSARMALLQRPAVVGDRRSESIKPAMSTAPPARESPASTESTPSDRSYRRSSTEKKRVKRNRKEENLLWPIIITLIIIVLLGLLILASRPPTR